MGGPELLEFVGEQIVVGNLALGNGTRRKPAVPHVLKRVVTAALRELYSLYCPTVYVEAHYGRAKPLEHDLRSPDHPQVPIPKILPHEHREDATERQEHPEGQCAPAPNPPRCHQAPADERPDERPDEDG